MNGWTTQSTGVAQEPQEPPAAESDTFREPFVARGYQIQQGDTETGWFCVSLHATFHYSFPSAPVDVPGALTGRGLVALVSEAPAQAGTAGDRPAPSQEELERHVRGVLEAARDEHFEDGMESSVSRALLPLVERHHTEMAEFLFYWLGLEKAHPDVGAEVLHWLGGMDHAPSHNWRRRLLERCLEASSVSVRDAAGIGLAAMDDPQAAHAVKVAIARERSQELRQCLERVLAQLEGKPGWRCF